MFAKNRIKIKIQKFLNVLQKTLFHYVKINVMQLKKLIFIINIQFKKKRQHEININKLNYF